MENKNERIEKLLALLLVHTMKGASLAERALALSLAGFTNIEIANLFKKTPATINQSLYAIRKQKNSKRKSR